jgi:DNA repair protein RecO (recombination protein O)
MHIDKLIVALFSLKGMLDYFMDWKDDGIVLSVKKHGETSAIVSLLTREHGRHLGLVRGGNGKRARGILQMDNFVEASWKARLVEQLGYYKCELHEGFAAKNMRDALRLSALSSACALAEGALAERETHRSIFDGLLALLYSIEQEDWPSAYVKWELGLLGEIGFGLDLTACVKTGKNTQLAYVSPKSGCAVSLDAGEPYKNKLLNLPQFLLQPGEGGTASEVNEGLKLTGYFLDKNVFNHTNKGLPASRVRLLERLRTKPVDAV